MVDIVVVGSCMTDLVSYVDRLPKPGETLHGHKFSVGFGGKGANQCIAAARLGSKVAMVAKLGKDSFGENYMKNFQDSGINVDHVTFTDQAATGVAPISVASTGLNSIVIVSGANLKLSCDDVTAAKDLIGQSKVMITQLEIQSDVTLHALKLAKGLHVKTILNTAPAIPNLCDECYQFTDVLCCNETEAEILTGQSVNSVEEAFKASEILIGRGCPVVIVTLGDKGAVIVDNEKNFTHIPTDLVKALDTTGAGDAFVGALAHYISLGSSLSLVDIVRRCNRLAAITVQSAGTQTSFPFKETLPADLFTFE